MGPEAAGDETTRMTQRKFVSWHTRVTREVTQVCGDLAGVGTR